MPCLKTVVWHSQGLGMMNTPEKGKEAFCSWAIVKTIGIFLKSCNLFHHFSEQFQRGLHWPPVIKFVSEKSNNPTKVLQALKSVPHVTLQQWKLEYVTHCIGYINSVATQRKQQKMKYLQVLDSLHCSWLRPHAVNWEHQIYYFFQFLSVLYEPLVYLAFERFLICFSCMVVQLEKS